ncbi:MAG: hypothetical protein ACI31S_03945 [Bacilli bacterium]
MNKEDKQQIESEILEEEYMLGNEYYNKLIEKAQEEKKQKYK